MDQQVLSPSKSKISKEVGHINDHLTHDFHRELEYSEPSDTNIPIESNHDSNISKKVTCCPMKLVKRRSISKTK
jgi:hypothetical protein